MTSEQQVPTVSIVTPSFNQAAFLRDTLESVRSQEGVSVEHIVMDGGSTDASPAILREFDASLAYWQSEKDGGQTDALIQGFARAEGEILGWLNSDDYYWDAGALRHVAEAFARHPGVDIITGDMVYVTADRKPVMIDTVWRPRAEHLRHYMALAQPATLWRRSAYERAGGLNPAMKFAMDYDLFQRMSQGARILRIPHILAGFRLQEASKTFTIGDVGTREQEDCRERMTGHRKPGLGAKFMGVGMRLGSLLAEADALLRGRRLPCLLNARIEPMRYLALRRHGMSL